MSSNASLKTLKLLQEFECRNITQISKDGSWPIVWNRARGCHVWDLEGRRYLDLTAAFGVVASGHSNPRLIRAVTRQWKVLGHAMGDVHPHELKARLLRELSRITFERWSRSNGTGAIKAKTILGNSGFEAVEAALKTALLASGKPGVIAFDGGYHGLGYGALNTTHRLHFRKPFARQLRSFASFAPFPDSMTPPATALGKVEQLAASGRFGAVLIEPIQARGGIRIPLPGFLKNLRRICDTHGILLVLDEIYTGFGRTGSWFACEEEKVIPDIICLGKALTGGFPLSACVAKSDLMDAAWPESHGEAIHTSTFLGHPVGCAMALAQLEEIRSRGLVDRSRRLGPSLLHAGEQLAELLPGLMCVTRGRGMMVGIEFSLPDGKPASSFTLDLVKAALHERLLLLPEGAHGNVLGLIPPLTITPRQIEEATTRLRRAASAALALHPRRPASNPTKRRA